MLQRAKYRLCKHVFSRAKYDKEFPGHRNKSKIKKERDDLRDSYDEMQENNLEKLHQTLLSQGKDKHAKELHKFADNTAYKLDVKTGREIIETAKQAKLNYPAYISQALKTGQSVNEIAQYYKGLAGSAPKH